MKTLKKSMIAMAMLVVSFSMVLAQSKAEIDKPAPDFTLTDSNGEVHSLIDYYGKYIVLEWNNYDCPFVKKHYDSDNMQKIQKDLRDKGVVWLAICSSAPGKQGHFDNAEINK